MFRVKVFFDAVLQRIVFRRRLNAIGKVEYPNEFKKHPKALNLERIIREKSIPYLTYRIRLKVILVTMRNHGERFRK